MSILLDKMPWPAKYAVASAIAGIALWARFALNGLLPPQGFPFLTFFPAVLLAAYLLGLGPGLLAAGLSVLAAYAFFIPRDKGHDFGIGAGDAIALAVFTAILLVDCIIIHELRTRSRELLEGQRRFLTLTQNSPDVITRFDRELRHVFVSRAIETISGRPAAEFIGKTNTELGMPPDLCSQWESALLEVFRSGSNQSLQFTFEGRAYSAILAPERDEGSGTISYVLGVTRDVTELARQQQTLEQRDKFKDQFIATVSHEIRNPLAAMTSCVGILKAAPAHSDAAPKALQILERQLKVSSKIVDDLLDLSRIRTQKLQMECTDIDLRDAVHVALETCHHQLKEKDLTLESKLPDTPALVRGDLHRLAQVFINLLSNASKFSPPGQRVEVSLIEGGDHFLVKVVDEGPGIPRNMLQQIFQPFEQAQAGLAHRGGLGIGLAIAEHIVSLHSGHLSASSEGIGRGATFEVSLPKLPAPEDTRSPALEFLTSRKL